MRPLRPLAPLVAVLAVLVVAPSAGAWKNLGHQAAPPAAPLAARVAARSAGAGKTLGPRPPPPAAPLAKASPQDVLRRTEQAFKTGGDLTPLLRQLALDLPRLSGAEKQRATSLLARPTDG